VSRRAAVVVACAGAFAALAALVAAGELTAADRWAVYHAMPAALFNGSKPTFVDAVVPLWHASWSDAGAAVTNLVTLPAAFTLATVGVALACLRLPRRAAAAVGAVYVAGNVVEGIVKSTLTRPALHHDGLHLAGFDASYPSGHALRSVLLAYAVALAWPRLRTWAAAWAACSVAMAELGGLHVPSDVAGGLLLAGALLATASAWAPLRPSAASRPSSRAR